MARINVEILGDSRSLEKAFARSARSATKFSSEVSRATRGAAAGSGVFRSFGRSVAFASGGFLAFASAASFVRASVDAAREAAVAQRSLQAQMEANSESFKAHRDTVEKVALSYAKFGFQNDDVIASLTVLDRATGSISKSMRLQGLVAGVARVKNLDLASAAAVVGKVFGGQETALRRAIPGLSKNAHGYDLIREAQKKLAGQAAANTTASERFQATLHDTQEIIGTALLPTLNQYLNVIAEWLSKSKNQKEITDDVKAAVAAATDVLKTLKGVLEAINSVTGSTRNSLKLLLAVLVTYKTLKIASTFSNIADSIGLIGTNARKARGPVKGLAGELGGPAGPPTPGAAAAGESTAAKFARNIGKAGAVIAVAFAGAKGLQKLIGQAPLLISPQSMRLGVTSPIGADPFGLGPREPGAVRPPAGVLGPAAAGARRPRTPPPPPVDPKFQRAANEAARQAAVDRLAFKVEQTQLTKSLTDDIAANEKLNQLLLRRIKGDHATLDLRRQQLQVQLTINDLLARQAESRKAAAQAARQAALDARTARQFAILGLGPTGQERVPGAAALRRELDQVSELPLGKKGRSTVERIRRLIRTNFKSLTLEVRTVVKQMLDDLHQQLDKSSSVDVTRFQETARGQLTLAGARPGGALVIQGGIHLHGVQNVKELENELARRRKQRAHARRSTR
jgi:hypothetical protein